MPTADTFEAPQGATFYGDLLQAVTEAFAGNGVLANGEANATADGSVDMGVNVSGAPTGIEYEGTTYTPPSASFTLSDGPTTTTNGQDDRRADIIVFDTSSSEYALVEGTPHPNPTPPETPADALLLSVVTVGHEATNVADSDILNWRARPNQYPNDGSEAFVDTQDIVDGTIVDGDVSASTTISRGKIDDERITVSVGSDVTTDGEEVVFVDTSSSVTVTLASADTTEGNVVTIVDAGGNASSNSIAVETEGSETIDGASGDTVATDYAAKVVVSDGDNWFTAGGGSSSGGANTVESGGYNIVDLVTLRPNERLKVESAELTLEKGQARPEGLTLQLAYFNRYQAVTQYRPIIDTPGTKGIEDGSTFTNLANFPRTVAVVVDNGQYGSGTGTAKSYRASATTTIQGDHNMTLVNIRPNAPAHIANTAPYTQQSSDNVGFYEITDEGDTIDFDLEQVPDLQDPTIEISTVFGTTDFDLVERDTGNKITSEKSGFDSDVWLIDVQNTSGKFRLTNFDDTQAAFYGYVKVYDAE